MKLGIVLKILVLHEIDYFRGPVFEFQEFSEAIQELGHTVMVLDLRERVKKGMPGSTGKSSGLREARTTANLIDVQTPWITIPGDVFRPLAVLVHIFALFRVFVFQRPDIVLSYSVPTSGPTVAIFGKLFAVPVVHRSIDVSHKLRPGVFDLVVKVAETVTFSLSTHISTHNKALAEYIEERGGKPQKISVHYPPVDLSHFESKKKSTPPVRIIFIGTLSHFTGLDDFLVTASVTASDQDWQLRVVGDGSERERLESLCRKLELENLVSFVGWKNYEDLGEELGWANVAIVPFRRNLLTDCALPQKTIQYIAAGLPVVSTALRGSVMELGDLTGIEFVDNPKEVFAACFRANRRDGRDAKTFLDRFDKQRATTQLVRYLEQIVSGSRSSNHTSDKQD